MRAMIGRAGANDGLGIVLLEMQLSLEHGFNSISMDTGCDVGRNY